MRDETRPSRFGAVMAVLFVIATIGLIIGVLIENFLTEY